MEEKSKKSFWVKYFSGHLFCGTLALILTLAACVYSMLDREKMPVINIPVKGQILENNINAAIKFFDEDLKKTDKINEEKLKKLPLFYRIDKKAENNTDNFMHEFFKEAEQRNKQEKLKMPYQRSNTRGGKLASGLSGKAIEVMADIYRNESWFRNFREDILSLVRNGILDSDKQVDSPSKRIRIIDADDRKHEPSNLSEIKTISKEAKRLADSVLASYRDRKDSAPEIQRAFRMILSEGQMNFDEKEQNQEIQRITIPPLRKTVEQGSILIRKGKTIDKYDIKRMQKYQEAVKDIKEKELQERKLERILQNTAITLLILLFCGLYLYHTNREILENTKIILMLTVTTIVSIFFNLLASKTFHLLEEQYAVPHNLLYIALPLGFAPLVLSVTYGMRCALFTGLFVTVIAALSTSLNDQFHVVLLGLMIGGISAFSVRRAQNHRDFFISAFLSISVTTLLVCLLVFWRSFEPIREISVWALTLPFVNGLLTSGGALIMIFFLEAVFEVSTDMSLLLYSNYNHPLLKRLQAEAPGTYFHSLSVASLAEAAAQRIGANPFKTRICALFHDVGKLSKPEFFTENNVCANPHKDLDPETSAKIIIDHVRDGIILARKYKLRKLICDAIQQHHGTDLVRFFYEKARESGKPVDEKLFRYDGPTPSRKEIALVMLADACEAASRSIQQPTTAKIDELVSSIIEKRMRGNQLNDANLTFRELRMIRESFVNTLPPMLHARVAYPTKTVHNENDLCVDKAK